MFIENSFQIQIQILIVVQKSEFDVEGCYVRQQQPRPKDETNKIKNISTNSPVSIDHPKLLARSFVLRNCRPATNAFFRISTSPRERLQEMIHVHDDFIFF